jgi:TonB family protein
MRKHLVSLLLLPALGACYGADFNGIWSGTIATGEGSAAVTTPLTLRLQQTGQHVLGSLVFSGKPAVRVDADITNDELRFDAGLEDRVLTFQLKVEGAGIAGEAKSGSQVSRVVLPHHVALPDPRNNTHPILIYKTEPEYTSEARKARLEETVLISTVIDETGRPTQLKVLKGLGMGLDGQALASVSKYKFKPATRDGNPVAIQVQVEVNFRLQ